MFLLTSLCDIRESVLAYISPSGGALRSKLGWYTSLLQVVL